jgi:hypothetical protein
MKFIKIKKGEKIPPFSQLIKEEREQDGGEVIEGSHGRDYYSPNYTTFLYLLVPEQEDYDFLKKKIGLTKSKDW